MKRVALALAALAAGTTLALAQQSTQPSTTPQERTAPPSDSSARSMSEADKQTLMKNCVKQVQAEHPGATQQDVKEYCDKVVKSSSAPR